MPWMQQTETANRHNTTQQLLCSAFFVAVIETWIGVQLSMAISWQARKEERRHSFCTNKEIAWKAVLEEWPWASQNLMGERQRLRPKKRDPCAWYLLQAICWSLFPSATGDITNTSFHPAGGLRPSCHPLEKHHSKLWIIQEVSGMH